MFREWYGMEGEIKEKANRAEGSMQVTLLVVFAYLHIALEKFLSFSNLLS